MSTAIEQAQDRDRDEELFQAFVAGVRHGWALAVGTGNNGTPESFRPGFEAWKQQKSRTYTTKTGRVRPDPESWYV